MSGIDAFRLFVGIEHPQSPPSHITYRDSLRAAIR